MNEDITKWDSGQLAAAILSADKSNIPSSVCKMIFHAEDTNFTVEEDSQLSSWLLEFAEKHKTALRSNGYDETQNVVRSAIRTGASMLFPKDARNLYPLLQPGQSTSIVAMKMLGRIFEAQPPTSTDQYRDLADDVLQMLNQHVIDTQSPSEIEDYTIMSYTILASYAIVAMGSDFTERIIEILQGYESWTTRRLVRYLDELQNVWKKASVSEELLVFLEGVIDAMDNEIVRRN